MVQIIGKINLDLKAGPDKARGVSEQDPLNGVGAVSGLGGGGLRIGTDKTGASDLLGLPKNRKSEVAK